jgi:hypothetical protein
MRLTAGLSFDGLLWDDWLAWLEWLVFGLGMTRLGGLPGVLVVVGVVAFSLVVEGLIVEASVVLPLVACVGLLTE